MANHDDDQTLVAAALGSRPADDLPADFLARVNARIDALDVDKGWLAIADFRAWTLRLAPIAGAIALLAFLWPARTSASVSSSSAAEPVQVQGAQADGFTPASASDWQRDITANALLDAALHAAGENRAR